MSKENKFEEARVKLASGIEYNISVDDITYLRNTNIFEYNKISKSLFCPECFKARLTHCSGSKILPYLRTVDGSSHDEDCSCLLDSLGKRDIENLYQENSTADDIYNRLKHLIEFICLGNISESNPLIYSKVMTIASKEEKISKEKTVRNYIPRKSITNGISDKDICILKFFYGKVYLLTDIKKDTTDNENYAFLRLYTIKDNKKGRLILSIRIGKKIFPYIPKESLESNKIAYISFFSYISKYEKNDIYYYNVKELRHSKHLCVVHIP